MRHFCPLFTPLKRHCPCSGVPSLYELSACKAKVLTVGCRINSLRQRIPFVPAQTSGVQDPDFGVQSSGILGIFWIWIGYCFSFNRIQNPDYPNEVNHGHAKKTWCGIIVYQEKLRFFEIILATIFFSKFSRWNAISSAARDRNVQTEDMSILKQFVIWNCVKISMFLRFYQDDARHFSDEIWLIFKSFIGRL